MYLLDTTHCCHILNRHSGVIHKLEELDNTPVATCVVVRGELIFGAYKSERRDQNISKVKELLKGMQVYSIDTRTADIYGEIKAAIVDYFGPKEKAKRRKFETQKLGFKENDLWIAAVAKRHGLTVVSGDSDFQRLQHPCDLRISNWIGSDP